MGKVLIIPGADFSENGFPTRYSVYAKVSNDSSSLVITMREGSTWTNTWSGTTINNVGTEKTVLASDKNVETLIKWANDATSINFANISNTSNAVIGGLKLLRGVRDNLTSINHLLNEQKKCIVIDFSDFVSDGINDISWAFNSTGDSLPRNIIGIETLFTAGSNLNIDHAFNGCRFDSSVQPTLDLSLWQAKVLDTPISAFHIAGVTTLKLSGWDFSSCRAYKDMFNCFCTTIYLNNTKFNTSNLQSVERMFHGDNMETVFVDGLVDEKNSASGGKTFIQEKLNTCFGASYIAQPQDINGNVVSIENAYKLVKTAI